MKFSLEDGFDCRDEVLQEVKASIFRISQDPLDLTQLEWVTQLSHVLECYKITTKEDDEDPWKINILEIEGH